MLCQTSLINCIVMTLPGDLRLCKFWHASPLPDVLERDTSRLISFRASDIFSINIFKLITCL